MPPVTISRNAEAALVVSQWIRNGKPVTAELQNKLASIVGYAASVSAAMIWHSPGLLSTTAAASAIPNSSGTTRRRWSFAWHTSPFASFVYIQMDMALQDNGTATDPHSTFEVKDASGTAVGTAELHAGSWGGIVSDAPAYITTGQKLLAVPTHSGGIDFITLLPDTEYTGTFYDYDYARLQSACVWEVSLTPTTENGWVPNTTPPTSPVFQSDRADVISMARLLHKRCGTPVFHWCAETVALAPTQSAAVNGGVLAMTLDDASLSATGTVSASAPTFQGAGTFTVGNGASISPPFPAGYTLDDIAILVVGSSHYTEYPVATPQDFQYLDGPYYVVSGDGYYDSLTFYWARCSTPPMTAPTINNLPTGTVKVAQIFTVRGCVNTGSPFDATQATLYPVGSETTGPSITGLSTTTPLCLVMNIISTRNASVSANYSGWTNASLASITERADEGCVPDDSPVRAHRAIGVATGVKTAAGAVSATTLTNAVATTGVAFTIAFKP